MRQGIYEGKRYPSGHPDRGCPLFARRALCLDFRATILLDDAPGRRIKNDLRAGMIPTPFRDDTNRR
jgi:hypothetical protein